MSSEPPRIESFILRFVQDPPDTGPWRGMIVHVQTDENKSFLHLADAIAFIARYVPVGDSLSAEIHPTDPKPADGTAPLAGDGA